MKKNDKMSKEQIIKALSETVNEEQAPERKTYVETTKSLNINPDIPEISASVPEEEKDPLTSAIEGLIQKKQESQQ